MARLLMLVLFVTLIITGSMAVKSCSERTPPSSQPIHADGSALVALRDGSTLMAERGTVGRALVDWLAAREPGSKSIELGGQEFVARTATPTSESIGRVSRLVAMLRANPDVKVMIIGHTDPSADADADHALGLERANILAGLLREGGISKERITTDSRGSSEPITSNDNAQGRARNQRVSLVLTRKD